MSALVFDTLLKVLFFEVFHVSKFLSIIANFPMLVVLQEHLYVSNGVCTESGPFTPFQITVNRLWAGTPASPH